MKREFVKGLNPRTKPDVSCLDDRLLGETLGRIFVCHAMKLGVVVRETTPAVPSLTAGKVEVARPVHPCERSCTPRHSDYDMRSKGDLDGVFVQTRSLDGPQRNPNFLLLRHAVKHASRCRAASMFKHTGEPVRTAQSMERPRILPQGHRRRSIRAEVSQLGIFDVPRATSLCDGNSIPMHITPV